MQHMLLNEDDSTGRLSNPFVEDSRESKLILRMVLSCASLPAIYR